MDEASRARIRVFLNDPAARGPGPVTSEPPRDTEKSPWGFRVEGREPRPIPYEPDTPEFLYWQIASALARGRALWSRLLPKSGSWVRGRVLPAIPVDGEGLNAFYDRKALHFFRDVDSATGAVVSSGDSPDIVTHEQGHAVLDAIRPDLWDAPHFEVAAFHEAFGDLAAILVALGEDELVRAVLEETGGSLDHSNLVSRLAEELAAAVVARYGPGAALPDALRDAVNPFRYRAPRSLPEDADADALSREPHSFSRVITGVGWDVLVRLYLAEARSTGVRPSDSRPEALSRASGELGRLLVVAASSAPVGASFFRRFARDLAAAAGANGERTEILEALSSRDLAPSGEARRAPDRDRIAAMALGGEALPTRILEAVRADLGAARDEEILLRPTPDGSLRGRRARDLVLSGSEYGPADGAAVEISDSFDVALEESGYVSAARVERAGPEEEEDAREFVRTLARNDRIAAEDEEHDPARLFREGKSHFVARESDGVRRLRRSWHDGRVE